MSNSSEKWWERLIRALGGWGLAGGVVWAIIVGKWPIDSTRMLVFAGLLISLGVGMAHSTVFGIWLGTLNRYVGLDRLVAFLTRRGWERRGPEEDQITSAQTRTVSSIKAPKRRRRDK